MRTPARGDIWFASLDATLGREQQGMRPLLVVSPPTFNRFGLSVVCQFIETVGASVPDELLARLQCIFE